MRCGKIKHHLNLFIKDENNVNITTEMLKIIWSKITIPPDYIDGCWIWTGSFSSYETPRFFIQRKQISPLRILNDYYLNGVRYSLISIEI